MAEIDEKMHALAFTKSSSKSRAELRQLFDDAGEVAQPEKIVLTAASDDLIRGVARNFVRVQHAAFHFALATHEGGATTVTFKVGDFMKTRSTVLAFIPVSTWSAPAYRTLKELSEYVQVRL